VIAVDPPNRLEMTFLARWDPELEAEGPVRQVWQIEAARDDLTKLTVTTIGLRAGSRMAEEFGNGMVFIVSGLKSFIEAEPATVAPA
jgi:uncharacterized protein YndB with AHSA1/START domain